MTDGIYYIIHNYEFKILNKAYNDPMTALTLTPRALYEEVGERLRLRIFSQELAPGSWIDELKIAEEYGISRTPLREALKVLATEGLITMKMRRGAYVTEVNEKDLSDVYHLLSLLESDAASVVATTATDEQLAHLQRLHAQLGNAIKDPEKFFAINEQFHMLILDISNNKWRSQMVEDLRKVMKLNRHNSLFKSGRIQKSYNEHQHILNALLERNAQQAALRTQQHFSNGLKAAA